MRWILGGVIALASLVGCAGQGASQVVDPSTSTTPPNRSAAPFVKDISMRFGNQAWPDKTIGVKMDKDGYSSPIFYRDSRSFTKHTNVVNFWVTSPYADWQFYSDNGGFAKPLVVVYCGHSGSNYQEVGRDGYSEGETKKVYCDPGNGYWEITRNNDTDYKNFTAIFKP